jgi:hypothetical protein
MMCPNFEGRFPPFYWLFLGKNLGFSFKNEFYNLFIKMNLILSLPDDPMALQQKTEVQDRLPNQKQRLKSQVAAL